MPSVRYELLDEKYLRRLTSMTFSQTALPNGAVAPDCDVCVIPGNRFVCRDHWTPNSGINYEIAVTPSLAIDWNNVLNFPNWADVVGWDEAAFPGLWTSESDGSTGLRVFGSDLRDHASVRTPGELTVNLTEFPNTLSQAGCTIEECYNFEESSETTIGTPGDGAPYTGDAPVDNFTLNSTWSPAIDPNSTNSIVGLRNANDGFVRRFVSVPVGWRLPQTITGYWCLKFDSGVTELKLHYEYKMHPVIMYGWYAQRAVVTPRPTGDVQWDVRMWKAVWNTPETAFHMFDAIGGNPIGNKNHIGVDSTSRVWDPDELLLSQSPTEVFNGSWTATVPEPSFRTDLSNVSWDVIENSHRTYWRNIYFGNGAETTVAPGQTFGFPSHSLPADDLTSAIMPNFTCTRRQA